MQPLVMARSVSPARYARDGLQIQMGGHSQQSGISSCNIHILCLLLLLWLVVLWTESLQRKQEEDECSCPGVTAMDSCDGMQLLVLYFMRFYYSSWLLVIHSRSHCSTKAWKSSQGTGLKSQRMSAMASQSSNAPHGTSICEFIQPLTTGSFNELIRDVVDQSPLQVKVVVAV